MRFTRPLFYISLSPMYNKINKSQNKKETCSAGTLQVTYNRRSQKGDWLNVEEIDHRVVSSRVVYFFLVMNVRMAMTTPTNVNVNMPRFNAKSIASYTDTIFSPPFIQG